MKFAMNIIDFFKSFGRPHPSRDWLFALIVLTIALAVLLGVAIFLFLGIRSGVIVGSAEGVVPIAPTVTRGELEAVLDAYQKKEINFDAENYPTPSLSDPAP